MHYTMRLPLLLLGCLAILLLVSASDPVSADEPGARHLAQHLSLALLSDVKALVPGSAFHVGVHMRMETGWHAYWKEPGDAGMAPSFEWSLPPGFEVDAGSWPVPAWHKAESTWTMVYEPDVLIVFRVRAPKTIPSVSEFSVGVDWVVCHDADGCVPGHASLTLRLPRGSGGAAEASADAATFEQHRQSAPRPMPKTWSLSPDRRLLRLAGEGPWTESGAVFEFYPQDFVLFDRGASLFHERDEGGVTLRLPFAETGDRYPDTFRGVLTIRSGGKTSGYAIGWSR